MSALRIAAQARFQRYRDEDGPALVLQWPDPARGLQAHQFAHDDPLVPLLPLLVAGRHDLVNSLSPAERDRLQRIGFLSGTASAALPPMGLARPDGDALPLRLAQVDCERCRGELASQGFATIPRLLQGDWLGAYGTYAIGQFRRGYLVQGDKLSQRHRQHNDRHCGLLHRQLAATISEVAGAVHRPTFTWLSVYRPGDALEPHIDRAECALSALLALRYECDDGRPFVWPLQLRDRQQVDRTIALDPGDALLFHGCELRHYRHALGSGQFAVTLTLHYAPETPEDSR